eukprot:11165386-Ditylum_brightwellii.AAC.1
MDDAVPRRSEGTSDERPDMAEGRSKPSHTPSANRSTEASIGPPREAAVGKHMVATPVRKIDVGRTDR